MSDSHRILGSAERRAWTDYSVKGNLVATRQKYVREKWGEKALRDVAARLDGETRTVFESPILPFAWYPFTTLVEIDSAIIEGPMGSDPSHMQAFGDKVARYDLPTLYKVLFKLGTPSFLIKRVGVVYQTYVRGGQMSASDVEATRAVVTLMEGALPLYFCRFGISGWFTAALDLSGARSVVVQETSCIHSGGRYCQWQAVWK